MSAPASLRAAAATANPDPATNSFVGEGDVRAQTRRVLENVRAILEAGGSGVEDVIMLRVYLTRREHFPAMNEVYSEFVAEHVPSGVLPSRTTVFAELPVEQMLVEIDALAVTSECAISAVPRARPRRAACWRPRRDREPRRRARP